MYVAPVYSRVYYVLRRYATNLNVYSEQYMFYLYVATSLTVINVVEA